MRQPHPNADCKQNNIWVFVVTACSGLSCLAWCRWQLELWSWLADLEHGCPSRWSLWQVNCGMTSGPNTHLVWAWLFLESYQVVFMCNFPCSDRIQEQTFEQVTSKDLGLTASFRKHGTLVCGSWTHRGLKSKSFLILVTKILFTIAF